MVSVRHPLFPAGLLAGSLATLLVACGGKVVVDGGGTGEGGAGGTTATTTAITSVGPGGVGGAGGCAGLEADLAAKLAAAQACNPALSVPQCSGAVTTIDTCGCSVVANDSNAPGAQLATTAFETWVDAGCGPFNCAVCPPPPSSPWYCDPTTAVCLPAYEK